MPGALPRAGMNVAARVVRPREPSFRSPVLIPMFVPVLLQSWPRGESEFVQSLLQQREKTRYLPRPIFRGRAFVCLGLEPMDPRILHVILGIAHLPLGRTLTPLGFIDAVDYIRDSVAQFAQHLRGTLWRDKNSIPSFRRTLVVSRSRVVRPVFFGAMLVRVVFVRAMRIRAMFFGTMFLGPPVPACLCNLLQISRLGLTSRVAVVGARGIRRVLVQRHKSARRQYCAQRQHGIRSAHHLLALGERDPPQSAQRLRRSASAQRAYLPFSRSASPIRRSKTRDAKTQGAANMAFSLSTQQILAPHRPPERGPKTMIQNKKSKISDTRDWQKLSAAWAGTTQ